MSLSSTSYRNNYTGNNATSVYPYTFKVFDNTQFEVKVRLIATGVETTLALTTDYTVSGVLSSTGGNITLVNASQAWLTSGSLLSTYEISIRRVLPLNQLTSIRNLTDFLPELHEDQFDRAVMIAQQIQGQIDASLRMATSVDPASFNPVIPATYYGANRPILMLNTTGTALEATPYTLANLIAAVTLGGPFTTSRVLQTNSGTGLAEASAVTNTELSYLSGVTSAIQTQLNNKQATITQLPIANGGTGQATKAAGFDALSPMTTGGDLIYGGTSGTGTRLANGTSGQVLKSNGGTAAPSWSNAPPLSLSILTASSATKTPAATNQYHALSGNSVTLAANSTYQIWASATFTQSGGSATYALMGVSITAANGADSSVVPAALSTVVTINSSQQTAGVISIYDNLGVGSYVEAIRNTGVMIVTTGGSPVTIYAVTLAQMTTPANARVAVSLNALRIY